MSANVKGSGTVTWLFVAILAISAAVWTSAAPPEPLTLAIPGRTNSTPWVAASAGFVAVAWGAAGADKTGDVMLAVSRDGGRSFAPPATVNNVAGHARISGEIAPRVALSPRRGSDPLITVTWNARQANSEIRSATSTDGGRTFTSSIQLATQGAAGDRGWQAATLDAKGALHAIWLDHRGMVADKAAAGGHTHKGEHDGVAMAQKSGLYYYSAATGERELFKGVCYCCKSAMTTGPKGEIYAAWRHVFTGNLRDIAFTVSRDGGKTFSPLVRVNHDNWAINGCPDDGPAMAVDAAGTVHLVWPTVPNGTEGALHYAVSRDGKAFSAPVRVPTLGSPKPSHPQITIDGAGRAVVAWDEVRNGVRQAALRRVTISRDGQPAFGAIATLADGSSAYPVLAAVPDGIIAAWTSGPPNASVIGVRVVE